ncbi:hypothetical protein BH24DEI2_BH24DEI2_11730 [soil metagenome]
MFADIRTACAQVAVQADFVRLNETVLPAYAATLLTRSTTPHYDTDHHFLGTPEATLAYVVTLDTVNFGSGYFPYLHKRPGLSGYFMVATCLKERFEASGALSTAELQGLDFKNCATLFEQPLTHPAQTELMTLFARALGDLGAWLERRFGGNFAHPTEAAEGSAETLATLLTEMPFFQDVSIYKGVQVPLYKRAQITASDLALAFDGKSFGAFHDLDTLTMFADNLVPHVLHMDGVLEYTPSLLELLSRGEQLPPDSPQEVELRAVALHVVERLVDELRRQGEQVSARQLDIALWDRGQAPRYRTQPRHRTRTVFY